MEKYLQRKDNMENDFNKEFHKISPVPHIQSEVCRNFGLPLQTFVYKNFILKFGAFQVYLVSDYFVVVVFYLLKCDLPQTPSTYTR